MKTILQTNRQRGYTLLEILIVSALMSGIMFITLDFMATSSDQIAAVTEEAFMQSQVQTTMDTVVAMIQESTSDHVTLYRFTDPVGGQIELQDGSLINATQVSLCFPTPRDQTDTFVFTSGGGSNVMVESEPLWQGVTVLARYNGWLWRYTDYNTHTYADDTPFRVTSITSSTITVTDGSSQTITFDRAGGETANQVIRGIVANVAQLEAPNYSTGQLFPDSQPMQLQMIAQSEIVGGTFATGSKIVTATMLTDVLTRNKN